MKKLLFIALLGLTIAACSKKTDTVTPDNASLVSGTYQMTHYRFDSATVRQVDTDLPLVSNGKTSGSGTMTVAKVSSDSVNIKLHIVQTGYADDNEDFGNFALKKNGSSYDLYDGATTYGTVDGTSFSYDESDVSKGITYRLIITARK